MGSKVIFRAGWLRLLAILVAVVMTAAACAGDGDDEAGDGLADDVSAGEAAPVDSPDDTEAPAPADGAAEEEAASGGAGQTAPPLPDPAFDAGVAPTTPGTVCAGTRIGMSCLVDGEWISYGRDNSPIPEWVNDVAACDDGRIFVKATGTVALLSDGIWSEVPIDSHGELACRGNQLWGHDFDEVTRFVDGTITTFATTEIFPDSDFPNQIDGIAVAPDGSAWLAGSDAVARYQNDTWTVWTEGNGFDGRVSPDAITIEENPDGSYIVWVSASTGVAWFENDGWSVIDQSFNGARAIAAADGLTVVPGFGVGMKRIESGIVTEVGPAQGLSSDDVRDLAIDDLGRVWAATSYGVTVFEDGVARTYRVDNSGLVDNDVYQIVVTGEGPQLPADVPEEWATVAGVTVGSTGVPVANVVVELCVENLRDDFSGETPCALDPYTVSVVSDENGRFEVPGLRAGRYVIAFNPGSGWTHFVDGSVAIRYSAANGQVTELGAFTLTGA